MENNIEDIRKNTIAEIKEKIKKNPKYAHPCNKERQEDMKRLGFSDPNKYIYWMQHNGILKSDKKIRDEWAQERGHESYRDYNRLLMIQKGYNNYSEYKDGLAKDKGFANQRDCREQWAKDKGYSDYNQYKREGPWYQDNYWTMSENEYCSANFAVHKGEKLLFKRFLEENVFEYVKWMGNNYPGFDFLCKNPRQGFIDKYHQFKLERGKEYKIQLKMRCLENTNGWSGWNFSIGHNNIPDYFILSAWKDRESLEPICILLVHKDEIIRGRKLWKRESFGITNKYKYIIQFKNYELKDELEKLKDICKDLKEVTDEYGNSNDN